MSQSALQSVRKYGFPRLDVRGVPLLPARAQRLPIPRLCQCRGPRDVVAVSVQGTPRRRDSARALPGTSQPRFFWIGLGKGRGGQDSRLSCAR